MQEKEQIFDTDYAQLCNFSTVNNLGKMQSMWLDTLKSYRIKKVVML